MAADALVIGSPRRLAPGAREVRPVVRVERRRRRALPPLAVRVLAAHSGARAVVVRPGAVRMRFADPSAGAVAGRHHGKHIREIANINGHPSPRGNQERPDAT